MIKRFSRLRDKYTKPETFDFGCKDTTKNGNMQIFSLTISNYKWQKISVIHSLHFDNFIYSAHYYLHVK